MKLCRITNSALIECLSWRESCLDSLRTPDFLLDIQQEDFYKSLKNKQDIKLYRVCDIEDNGRLSPVRYEEDFIAVCGFVNYSPINRNAEISLIINPKHRDKGYGEMVLSLLLDHGFKHLGLDNIYGETYMCANSHGFWKKLINKNKWYSTLLPERKYLDGKLYDSIYFNIKR